MAKYTQPKLFSDPYGTLSGLVDAIKKDTLIVAQQQAQSEGMDTKRMPNYLVVTEQRMAKKEVIDLKPFFASSSHRKYNKSGDWYMYIPISVKRRSLSSRAYNELRTMPLINTSSRTVYSKYLYDNYTARSSVVDSINYQPKSNNITITSSPWGDGTRRRYIAFRTVNAKSPASSWIINRGAVNKDTFSPTMIKNIDRVMKYKLRNM